MTRVAFIGLGTMGFPMAANLLNGDFQLVVNDISRAQAEGLVAKGAEFASTPAEAADGADFVLTMLPADQHVRSVVTGEGGITNTIRSGAVYVDFSTIGPTTIREIGEKLNDAGVRVLDAAVGPGVAAATVGELTIMVGGDEALVEDCRAILNQVGQQVIHCGSLGSGKVVKLANNLVTGITNVMNAEAFVLATKAGADPAVLAEVMNGTSACNRIATMGYPRQVFTRNFTPGFKLSLMRKDVGLAVDLAKELGTPHLLSSEALEQYDQVLRRGWSDDDLTNYIRHLEEDAGVVVQSDHVPSYLKVDA